MEIIDLEDYKEERYKTSIALGNFDGVHIGHKELIKTMVAEAKRLGNRAAVLIFYNHTREIIEGRRPDLLTSNPQKEKILKELGVEIVYKMKFNESIRGLSPEEFVQGILIDKLNIQSVTIGFDYRFGYKASGDAGLLKTYGDKYNFFVNIIDPIYLEKHPVSSTRIRSAIREGNISLANKMLGRNYSLQAKVVAGKGIGRRLKFPTANLETIKDFVIPRPGVYVTETMVNKKKYLSVTSVGTNPTFNEKDLKVETHIIDFDENIYGRIIEVGFIDYLREEIKFPNVVELKNQIEKDILLVRSRY